MRTTRSSSRHGGLHSPQGADPPLGAGTPWSRHPPGTGTTLERAPPPPDQAHSTGCGPGDPLARPLNFLLGVGLETCKACWDTPPGDLLQGMLGYHLQCMLGYHPPPVDRLRKLRLRVVIKVILISCSNCITLSNFYTSNIYCICAKEYLWAVLRNY